VAGGEYSSNFFATSGGNSKISIATDRTLNRKCGIAFNHGQDLTAAVGESSYHMSGKIEGKLTQVGNSGGGTTQKGQIIFSPNTGDNLYAALTLDDSGYAIFGSKVGIGTSSPGYLLDVDGVARFRSTTRFAPGSAAWPSITYHSDVDTGIWFPGDGTVAISTNGTEAFRLDTSQNAKFAAIVTAVGRLQVTGNGTPTVTGGGLELGYKSSESSSKILSIDRNGNAYRALELAASSHSFKIGTTVKFDINASGNATFAGTRCY